MGVQLVVHDGSPWWMSPDIWVVPGSDPMGASGQPVVGQQAFVWTRVQNVGATRVTDASVRCWWADPSTAITRASAHRIGTSAVALEPEETKEVLCLSPWTPTSANGGHQCLIAEAFAPADPLPPHLDTTPFDPPGDRHVAQRNVTVLFVAPMMAMAFLPFMAGSAGGAARVLVRRMLLKKLDRVVLAQLGACELREADVEVRVSVGPFWPGEAVRPFDREGLSLRPGEPRLLALVAELGDGLADGTAVLVTAEQVDEREHVTGGVALLVVGSESREREQREGNDD